MVGVGIGVSGWVEVKRVTPLYRERGREGVEGERESAREGGREGGRERGSEGARERGSEGARERGGEG